MPADVSGIFVAVDASAAVAAAYVPGIRAAYGVGSGLVTVPTGGIYAGQLVPPYAGAVTEPYTHVSFPPRARPQWLSQNVTQINWQIPMWLTLDENDPANWRQTGMGFFARYLSAFSQHVQLLNHVNSAVIDAFDWLNDTGLKGIAMTLQVWERLDLENLPG